MAKEYDLVVLGGGTGGYVAAIRAAQLGMKTAVVEKDKLGGTCLHRGCIPTKALLRSAEVYATAKNGETFGVKTEGVRFDYKKAHERKQQVINQLHRGVTALLKKGKIDVYEGTGAILGPSIFSPLAGTVSVERKGRENEMLIGQNVLVATGSKPQTLPGLEPDGERVFTSDEAIEMKALPKSIVIIGGGAIGIEWASMFADVDVEVTVLEYAETILPREDREIAREMTRFLKKKGVQVITGARVLPETLSKNGGVTIKAVINDEEQSFQAEKMLVSVGRQAAIDGIGLENTNIKLEKGFISVNEFYQTKEKHIYAIGDCIGGLQLAHVAAHEGVIAVEHMAKKTPEPIDSTFIPRCVYSRPEVAAVGLTEEEAREKGIQIKIGKFPFQAIGKALVFGESDGFVKFVTDARTNDLLGVHMIGPHVTDLISEAALARLVDAAAWEVAQTIHPHPTLAEVMGEAALAVEGIAIHS